MAQVFPVVSNTPLGHNSDPNNTTPMGNMGKGMNVRIPELPLSAVVMSKTIPAGAAGADLVASGAGFGVVPAGHRFYVLDVSLVALDTAEGIDADNTCLVAVHDLTAEKDVAVKTFTDEVLYPAKDGVTTLTISDHNILNAGAVVGIKVTQGTTADHNGFVVQISGLIEKI